MTVRTFLFSSTKSAIAALVVVTGTATFLFSPLTWAVPPTAVIQVTEAPFLQERRDTEGEYLDCTVTDCYAPMPVFFEGWQSSPRDEIKEYRWDFGIGSSNPDFRGFNAAHVYEEGGTYTVRLTVENFQGETSTATVQIDVRDPDGTTYFVDAENGDDSNNGASPSTAWQTAAHAFQGMAERRYGPGDRILFTRGQTFEMTTDDFNAEHWQHGYGYHFGATNGTGHKPVIQVVGGQEQVLLFNKRRGMAFISFVDLAFRMTTPGNEKKILYSGNEDAQNVLFLRCNVQDMLNGILNGQPHAVGFFVVSCNFYNSAEPMMWGKYTNLALLQNNFDLSDNHVLYLSTVQRGVVSGNLFARPAQGRHAFRLCNADDVTDTNNVVVSHNRFRGWIDPDIGGAHGDGTRYPWLLVHLGPNKGGSVQRMSDVLFEHNILEDAETVLNIGSYENLVVRKNVMSSRSTRPDSLIILGSKHGFDQRPLKNIVIEDNTIRDFNEEHGFTGAIFEIRDYEGPTFEGRTRHEDIRIMNNDFHIFDWISRVYWFTANQGADVRELVSDNNTIFWSDTTGGGLFQLGGDKLDPGALFSLSQWQNHPYFDPPFEPYDDPHDGSSETFGGDANTVVVPPEG